MNLSNCCQHLKYSIAVMINQNWLRSMNIFVDVFSCLEAPKFLCSEGWWYFVLMCSSSLPHGHHRESQVHLLGLWFPGMLSSNSLKTNKTHQHTNQYFSLKHYLYQISLSFHSFAFPTNPQNQFLLPMN